MWFIPKLLSLGTELDIITVLVERRVTACDVNKIDLSLPWKTVNFLLPTDEGEETTTATLPVSFIEDAGEETDTIKDNFPLKDIDALPLDIGVVETRTVWIVLNEGVTCATGAIEKTVTVGEGLNEGGDGMCCSFVAALDAFKGEFGVERVV